jgi:hypothetical protein
MQLGLWEQQYADIRKVVIDYTSFLPAAVTIASGTAAIDVATTPPLSVTFSPNAAGTQLIGFIQGGIAGQTYNVTITTTFSDTQVKNDVLVVNITED